MRPIDLLHVQHVKIPVSDVVRSSAWYRELLGLELTHEFMESGVVRGVSLLHRTGGFSIALRERAAIAGEPDLRGFDPFALGVRAREDLEELVQRCQALGIDCGAIEERADGSALDIPDPDGTVVRFYHLTSDLHAFTGLAFASDGSVQVYEEPVSNDRASTPIGDFAKAMRDIDARCRALLERGSLSGAVRISRGGVVELEGCYGLADRAAGVPVHPGTRFGLASMTKMLTAVAVAQLVGDGRLTFEAPVVDVLPAERRPSTLRDDVTVHHLLTHTSGIADYFEEEDAEEMEEYAALWADRPSYRMQHPADFLPLFGDLPPYRPPGERFQYSNAGYIVLGLVIEEITGAAYTDVVEQRVLAAAGMADSGFFGLDEVRPDVAVGYLPPREEGDPWRTNVYAIPIVGGPDGGAFASAPDLDRFLTAYDDGTLLDPSLRDAMLTPYETTEEGVGVGRGVFLRPEGHLRRFGHDGGDPGVEGFLYRYPELDVNAVILCNVNDVADDVLTLVLDAIEATV